MAYDFDATNDIISFTAGSRETTAYSGSMFTDSHPMTIACWARVDNSGTNIGSNGLPSGLMTLIQVGATAENSYSVLQLQGNVTDDPFRAASAKSSQTAVGATAVPVGGLTSNRWYHVAGVFETSTKRRCFVDGISGSENTSTMATFTGPNRVNAGCRLLSTFSTTERFNGKIAEIGVWTAVLTDIEIASLAKGISPAKVRPQSLEFYSPLIRERNELFYERSSTDFGTGPTVFEHPRIFG